MYLPRVFPLSSFAPTHRSYSSSLFLRQVSRPLAFFRVGHFRVNNRDRSNVSEIRDSRHVKVYGKATRTVRIQDDFRSRVLLNRSAIKSIVNDQRISILWRMSARALAGRSKSHFRRVTASPSTQGKTSVSGRGLASEGDVGHGTRHLDILSSPLRFLPLPLSPSPEVRSSSVPVRIRLVTDLRTFKGQDLRARTV